MSLYSSCTSAASSAGSSMSSTTKPSEIDGLLAGAGYRVRSSDLRHVAQRLEHLDAAMVNSPAEVSQLASNAVHYNPSDIASWVDSLLSEFNQTASLPSELPEVYFGGDDHGCEKSEVYFGNHFRHLNSDSENSDRIRTPIPIGVGIGDGFDIRLKSESEVGCGHSDSVGVGAHP